MSEQITTTEPAKGKSTSEFLLFLLAIVLTALLTVLQFFGVADSLQAIAASGLTMLGSMGYAFSRTVVKANASKAEAAKAIAGAEIAKASANPPMPAQQ